MFIINQNLIDDFTDKINEKEKKNNKVTSWSPTTTDAHYPSEKLVKDSLDSKASSSHTHGNLQNNGQVGSTAQANKNVVTDSSGKITTEDKPTIPSASSTTPSADTTNGSVGTGTTWARSNHTHPKSSLYAEASHTHPQYLTSHQDITGKEDKSNKVTNISPSSTDTQYPSAKLVYNQLNNKAPTSHASSSTTYGVATNSNYGHTKVINNLTTSVASNGQALNAYQGKVLNDNKIDKNDFNVNYVHSFIYNSSIEKYAYQGQSGAVGIGVSAIDENNNSLLNEDGVAIIDLVFQNTNINYGSIQLVLAEADGERYTISNDLSNTQTIATITDTNKHHITIVVSPDTHIEEQSYDYYDLKVSKISYDGSNITVSSGKTSMERVGVYLVLNGAIGGNIEYMNVIKRTPIVNQIIDMIYPIGSTYISVNSVNPSFLFGGTWEQLKDKFLLASGDTYSNGATGGSATVSLSASQMPRHNHSTNSHYHTASETNEYYVTSTSSGASNKRVTVPTSGSNYADVQSSSTFHHRTVTGSASPSTKYTGGTGSTEAYQNGSAHENMPPYLVVYMWKRIA